MTKLYDLIVNLKYYARFLRTNNANDAVRAVIHPKDSEDDNQGFSQTEQQKAVETCQNQNQGKIALVQWRKKSTAYNRNIAFTILRKEKQDIPDDLYEAVLKAFDQQIEDYETNHPSPGNFDENLWQYSILKTALEQRKDTKKEVFKQYAEKWESPDAKDELNGWVLLKQRYKKRREREKNKLKDRLKEPNLRVRERKEILEELDKKI